MAAANAQRFGPYVVLDRIGDGGMAEIFLAKKEGYSGFEKLLALKRIHPKYSRNDTFAQMLIHEAKLAAALTHFNVVQVHDLGEIERQVYIAMEYVRGRDLAAVLSNTYRRKERLPIELSLFVGTEFITGLEYAHRMRAGDGTPLGIIHRDISPQNILISYEGEVKVTDFGIARIISEKDGFQLPGNLHGKFGYMSPEQALNREIDQRSDVFSAGVVLWEMLVGARLFRGRDHRETVGFVTSKEIPLPSSINPQVPPSVDRICLKALSRSRRQRYQTMGALLGELSRAADSLPRRAGSRDLSVYMRRQFGSPGGGFTAGRATNRSERSALSQNSGFDNTHDLNVTGSSPSHRIPLGQILLQQGTINMGELELALAEQRAQGGRIGEVLVSTATIDDEELAKALAVQADLPSIGTEDLGALPAPTDLIARYPRGAAETQCILPIAVDAADRRVRLAVSDPYNERGILEAKVVLGTNDVALLVAPRSAIRGALADWYPEDEPGSIPGSAPLFLPQTASLRVPRVLIADADVVLAHAVAERLRSEGFQVDVVHDGKSARSLCRKQVPMVALLDAALPSIDGYNLLLEIRASDEDAAVFITSERGNEFRQSKALELGADDFWMKPLALEVTASKVRREVRRRSSGSARLAPPMTSSGVNGSLEDMSVIDIAQSLELGRKTAHVVVQYEDERQGLLRVDDGDVRGAKTQGLDGEDAFYNLALPGRGRFRIEYVTSSLAPNISKPNTFLMIEAMRHLDEGTTPKPTVRRQGPPSALPSDPDKTHELPGRDLLSPSRNQQAKRARPRHAPPPPAETPVTHRRRLQEHEASDDEHPPILTEDLTLEIPSPGASKREISSPSKREISSPSKREISSPSKNPHSPRGGEHARRRKRRRRETDET